MRKLTIGGKMVAVWFEKSADVLIASDTYNRYGYIEAGSLESVNKLLKVGCIPMTHTDLMNMEHLLAEGQPVLFCIQKQPDRFGADHNPLINRLHSWRLQYPGLVAFGSRETETWRLIQEHAESFDLLGYS